jgi:hypothetical protein
MNTKKYLYAAVGAQVAVAKSAQARIEDLMAKLSENASSASSDLKSRVDTWAGEGEQFLGKVTDTKAIDELTAKVDFDQVQTQVNKLRDQLEDIVSTWRANFRPESKAPEKVTVTAKVETATPASEPVAKTTATSTAATKKPAAKRAPAAKKPAAKTTAAKTTAAKTTTAKKPAAKAPAKKATAQKAS